MFRKIKFYAVTVLILALAGSTAYLYWFGRPRGETVVHRRIDPPAIVQEIQALSELVTTKYGIQKVIGLEEEKIPFGSEQLLILVRGEVLGGIDLSRLSESDLSVGADNSLAIRLPPPRVLHVYLVEKDTQTWDRKTTWWTPWVKPNPELEKKARLIALEAVQAAAMEMGILQKAQENAETAIAAVLATAGFKEVRFERNIEMLRDR